jgi:GTPase Era involved in 16S rRNA processing
MQKNTKTAKVVDTLKKLGNTGHISAYPELQNYVEQFIERLLEKSFCIAVVGEFSSGKSTFLNALVRKDVLGHGAQETTATITRIVNTKPENEFNGKCRIYFAGEKESCVVGLSELNEYTTTKSAVREVVREVAMVDVFMFVEESEIPLFFVDTPGLNGVADHHREKTLSHIRSAHVCVYMLPRRGLSKSDCEFLKLLTEYHSSFIMVQNAIDAINTDEGETVEGKLAEQRQILDSEVFLPDKGLRYQLCGVSAAKALIAKDPSLKRLNRFNDEEDELTDQDRERLYQESNFEEVREIIRGFITDDEREEAKFQDTVRASLIFVCQVIEEVNEKFRAKLSIWEGSLDKKLSDKLQEILDTWNEREQESLKRISNFCTTEINERKREMRAEIDRLSTEALSSIESSINSAKTLEILENFAEKSLGRVVNNASQSFLHRINELIAAKCQYTQSRVLARVKEYSGVKLLEKTPGYDSSVERVTMDTFAHDESAIATFERNKADIARRQARHQKKIDEIHSEKSSQEYRESSLKSQKQQTKRAEKSAIDGLGYRPAAVDSYYWATRYEKRGGLGFLDALLGDKEVEYKEWYKDDSAGEVWDRRMSDIRNEYSAEITGIENSINANKSYQKSLEQDLKRTSADIAAADSEMQGIQRLLDAKTKELQEKREKARSEYMNSLKDSMRKSTQDYFFNDNNGLVEVCRAGSDKILNQAEKSITKLATESYTKSGKEERSSIEGRLKNTADTTTVEKLEGEIDVLIKLKEELEEFIS